MFGIYRMDGGVRQRGKIYTSKSASWDNVHQVPIKEAGFHYKSG